MKKISLIKLAKILFPINRSLTGKGNLKTLQILKKICKRIKIKKYNSGQKVFDWKIPNEWNVNDAFIKTPDGQKICDYKKNNLHLIGYSTSIKKKINIKKLKEKLHTHQKLKHAIPYLTSYYKKDWGFCISNNQLKKLKPGKYFVNIDTSLKKTHMHYGEYYLKGKSRSEIFLSTYICHPSMANNEISGPIIALMIAKWLADKKKPKYSYRILFVSETIGSIAYLYHNKNTLKKNVIAGFNITCVGDEKSWSLLPSKYNNTLSDRVSKRILNKLNIKYKLYGWLERGSDERQYCSPGIDLPITSIMRSKYGTYPEYHTSLDKIGSVVTSKGLRDTLNLYKKVIIELENSIFPIGKIICEPNLSKRNLYPYLNKNENNNFGNDILNFLTYADGQNSLEDIYEKLKYSKKKFKKILSIIKKEKLIKLSEYYKKKL